MGIAGVGVAGVDADAIEMVEASNRGTAVTVHRKRSAMTRHASN
jgi:hypothetical protein